MTRLIQLLNRASSTASQTATLVLQKNLGCAETGVFSTPIQWLPSVYHRKHYTVEQRT